MKGIYLASYKAEHPGHNIKYQDINVKNANRFTKYGLFNLPCFIYEIGRHTYWTNIFLSTNDIEQNSDNIQNTPQAKRQGGNNVHNVIEQFLKDINA